MPAVYTRHKDLIQILFAAFVAGGLASNLYVTRDAADETTASLSAKIDQLVRSQAEQQALVGYRLEEHERRLVALEHDRTTKGESTP